MLTGLRNVFHRDRNKPMRTSIEQTWMTTSLSDSAPRKVRLSDVTEQGSEINAADSSQSRRHTSGMDARPLPSRRNKSSMVDGERSTQALALAMMGEGKEMRSDGTLKIASTITTPAEIMCCRYSSTGEHLAIGMTSGDTNVYQTDGSGAVVCVLQDADTLDRTMPVTCSKFVPVPEGKSSQILITTYGDGLIKYWRFSTGEAVQTLDVDEQVLALSFDCLGKYFQIAGEDGAIRVYDVATGQQAGRLRASSNHALNDGHRSRVFALAAHPYTPQELLSAGWDNTVQFWDMRHPHAVRRIYGPHICGEGLSIDPSSNQVATASWRRRQALQTWDYGSGELITDIQPDSYESMQTCAQYMGSDFLIASGGFANVVRMIDVGAHMTTGIVRNLPQSVRCQDVSVRPGKQTPRLAACHGSDALIIDTYG